MIKSFRHKGLKKFFTKNDSSKLPASQVAKIRYILTRLNAAQETPDMNYSGASFHQLSGSLKEFYSVKVTGSYRIIFRFLDGHAYDVDYLDYH